MHFFMTERHEVSFVFHYLRYTELCMYTLVHFVYENKVYVYTWRIQIECKCTPGLRFPLETLVVCEIGSGGRKIKGQNYHLHSRFEDTLISQAEYQE